MAIKKTDESMGKWLKRMMERKELEEKISDDIPKINTDKTNTTAVPAYFDELEREYFFNLVELWSLINTGWIGIWQSGKLG